MTRLAAVALAVVLLAACGGHDHSGDAAPAATKVTAAPATSFEIDMRDTVFAPEQLSVPAGRVTFVFHNRGTVDHDAFIGDEAEQDAHEEEMAAGHGDHGSDHGASVTVAPGKTGRLTHIFTADDRLLIGCHVPGHYKAGMRITVDVKD